MIVISDTTPLITLMKIDQLELIRKLFKTVIIPQAVYDELTSNPSYQEEAEQICHASFIEIETVDSPEDVARLMDEEKLDIGESEAIILYRERSAQLLLMDERRGRKVAQSKGMNVMGTAGIIVNSVYNGYLSQRDCETCQDKLAASNIRLKDSILTALEDAAHGKFQSKILSKVNGFSR